MRAATHLGGDEGEVLCGDDLVRVDVVLHHKASPRVLVRSVPVLWHFLHAGIARIHRGRLSCNTTGLQVTFMYKSVLSIGGSLKLELSSTDILRHIPASLSMDHQVVVRHCILLRMLTFLS